MNTESLDKQAERVVGQGVLACASSLVATLAAGGNGHVPGYLGELCGLAEQAFELAAPVLDYEEAAREAGWSNTVDAIPTIPNPDRFWMHPDRVAEAGNFIACESAKEACAHDDTEPHEREVFEHWIVDPHLADDLVEVGEKVDTDFAGLCVWARTTTGQLIAADACMAKVVALHDKRHREAIGEG